MHLSTLRLRSAGALAAAVAAVALAGAQTAGAAPVRTATTTSYTTATYLQHALGLPPTDTDPAIEPVTYDRFQWLLQQAGNLPVLIGDPTTDASFKDRAQDVEAAAKAAGVKRVYWFNPNLSGNAKVGTVTEPNLDIRKPAGITSLDAASREIYDDAWLNLVGLYLGDGVTVTPHDVDSEDATVTAVTGTATVNDDGRTPGHGAEVGANGGGGALYDYSGGSAPADVDHSYFLIYNKANTAAGGAAAKIVAWTDLTGQAGSTAAKADVTTAIGVPGASNLAATDEFAWWKSEVNAKQATQAPNAAQGVNAPVLTDADATDGWRIHQVTYPELADLLQSATGANAVVLFGGTWCPNTRPVLPSVNRYAQDNGVQVFNFDTVLDGGLVGDATTSAINPLQIRNTTDYTPSGQPTITKHNPSFLYGDLVDQHLTNIKTQYDYTKGGSKVTYFANGGTAGTTTTTRKLQVPFLIGYQGDGGTAPHGGVTRQWIIDKGGDAYTEYMSQWWYTNPRPNELGITTIPLGAPVWQKLNAALATFTWRSDPTKLYANSAVDADDADYLVDADTASVGYDSGTSKWTITSGGATAISPAALSSALSALGASAPTNLAGAKAAWIAAKAASPQDPELIGNLTTVVGAWGVAQLRKTKVNSTWGSATSPGSVAGGVAAVHALDVFFGGLPGGAVSRRTVSADPVTAGTAPTITIKIDNDYGRVPAGPVSLVVKQGGTTVASQSASVTGGAASFTLPALGAGTYDYALSYAGDDQLLAFTETGTLTVAPAPVAGSPAPPAATPAPAAKPPVVVGPLATPTTARVKVRTVRGVVVKAPTSRKAGKYRVTITVPEGAQAAGGKVTITLKKGKARKTLTGRLSRGVVTVTLPKLARGTWKVTIAFPGDTRYLRASVGGGSIKVIK